MNKENNCPLCKESGFARIGALNGFDIVTCHGCGNIYDREGLRLNDLANKKFTEVVIERTPDGP